MYVCGVVTLWDAAHSLNYYGLSLEVFVLLFWRWRNLEVDYEVPHSMFVSSIFKEKFFLNISLVVRMLVHLLISEIYTGSLCLISHRLCIWKLQEFEPVLLHALWIVKDLSWSLQCSVWDISQMSDWWSSLDIYLLIMNQLLFPKWTKGNLSKC